MKQILFVGALLLMAFVYLSWRHDGGPRLRTAATATTTATTNAMPAPAPTGNGQPVTRDQYQPCLDSFVAVMGRYGITPNNPPVKNTSCPAMTYPITTSESFQASGFISWMQGIVSTYDPDGKGANLDFQLKFGVCTPKFVADLGQPAELTGRITVFVVAAYRTTAAASAAKAKAAMSTPGTDPGGTGYELGGLQP
jgi:hypothetical protein